MSVATNPFALAARLTKAHKLAAHLHRQGITANEAKLLTANEWLFLARKADVKWDVRRSRAETIALTIRQLGELERFMPELSEVIA